MFRADLFQAHRLDRKWFARIECLAPESNATDLTRDLLTVGDDQSAYGLLYLRVRRSRKNGHRSRESMGHEEVISMRSQRHQDLVLTVVAAKNDPDTAVEFKMTAYGQELDVAGSCRFMVPETVTEFLGEVLVCEQTAAGRCGKTLNAISLGKLQLDHTAASADTEEFIAIDETDLFSAGWREKRRGERSEDKALESRVPLDDMERVATLRHGPLAKNLAGYQKRGPKLIHDGSSPGQHVDLAVDAGIDVLSVAVLRVPDQVYVVLAQVHDAEVDADGL